MAELVSRRCWGKFVPAGAPLVRIEGPNDDVDRDAVTDALRSALERTLDEDLAYGFRMLVDMAIRSLSESPFSDPTTAVQCVDRLHDGLRQLVVRDLDDSTLSDHRGAIRVTIPTMDWEAYVALAFDEIRIAGASSPQVTRRLAAALDDLIASLPPDERQRSWPSASSSTAASTTPADRDATMTSPSLPIPRASAWTRAPIGGLRRPAAERPAAVRTVHRTSARSGPPAGPVCVRLPRRSCFTTW
jgi:uncharacterized membrane protein